jgi:Fic family protein
VRWTETDSVIGQRERCCRRSAVEGRSCRIDGLARLPISTRLVRDAHRVLLSGVARHRGAVIEAGELKRVQNWIGGNGRIDSERSILTPPADTPDALFAFVNREDRPAPLIDAALVHYQFEAIHPFADGNGRVERMLITLMLIENGTLPEPLLFMSPYLERHKDRYIDLTYAVSREGAWEAGIALFLEAVAASEGETIAVVERLQDLQRSYRERFQTARRSALMLRIIDLAFERPVVRLSGVAEMLGASYPTAANNVGELIAQGVAEEVGGTYPKLIRFSGDAGGTGGGVMGYFRHRSRQHLALTLDNLLSIFARCAPSPTPKPAKI